MSFRGLDFSGNSVSLIGTWAREPYSASCENDYNNSQCIDNNGLSKLVFTQNSLTLTECAGEPGEIDEYEDKEDGVIVKTKVIDCGTMEQTKGTQTIRIKYLSTEFSATYNGKTCNGTFDGSHSKSQMQKTCTDAYNSNGNYYEILSKYLLSLFPRMKGLAGYFNIISAILKIPVQTIAIGFAALERFLSQRRK